MLRHESNPENLPPPFDIDTKLQLQKEKKIEIKILGIIERNKIQGKIDWNKTEGKQFHQKQQENKAYRTVPLENYRICF